MGMKEGDKRTTLKSWEMNRFEEKEEAKRRRSTRFTKIIRGQTKKSSEAL